MRVFYLLVWCIGTSVCAQNTLLRTNWGVIFNKVGSVLNGITKYQHTFAVAIPNTEFPDLRPMSCNTINLREAHCVAVNKFIESTNEIYKIKFRSMSQNLKSALNMLPQIDDNQVNKVGQNRRHVRETNRLSPSFCENPDEYTGNENWIGNFFSSLMGTPTFDDMKIVSKHICEIADSLDIDKQEIKSSNERLSSISGLLNNRIVTLQHGMSNMSARITETQSALTRVAHSIQDGMNNLEAQIEHLQISTQAMYTLLNNIETFSNQADTHINYIHQFIEGLETLFKGYLPINFVTLGDVQNVINYIQRTILKSNNLLTLVHPNAFFYYQVKSVVFSRSENYLFITMLVPLKAQGGLLNVYRIDQTHLSITPNHTSSTKIVGLPDFFAITHDKGYYTEMSLTYYTSCKGEDTVKICSSERALQDSSFRTCSAAIFFNDIKQVMENCDIRFEEGEVPNQMIRIGEHSYLVHENEFRNVTWTQTCHNNNHIKTIPSCSSCVITIPCGCSLQAESFVIPPQLAGCVIANETESVVSKQYPVNLPMLSTLYSVDEISNIEADSLYDESNVITADFDFNITSSNWEEVVSKDELYKIDFKRLMANHKKKSTLYANRAEYYLEKSMDFSDLNMHKLTDLEKFLGGDLIKAFVNPASSILNISLFWIIAIATLFMSCYNCSRASR